jgi:hypothetical protein
LLILSPKTLSMVTTAVTFTCFGVFNCDFISSDSIKC